jgi:hypothetical protein
MVLGMSLQAYTLLHVLISLAGIGSGIVVMYGLLSGKRLDRWTAVFLITTAATSITGFGFPLVKLLPSHIIAAISLVVLAIASVARYSRHLAGAWRSTYVITAALALYFNVFVLVVQSFEKVPALKALAPTQKEPPFAIAQLVVLAAFVWLTILAVKRFKPAAVEMAKASVASKVA